MESRKLSDFECSAAVDKHLTFNSVPLSCGHYVCFSCLPLEFDSDPLICVKCGAENNANVYKRQRFSNFDHHVNFNLEFLYTEIEKAIQSEKEKYKGNLNQVNLNLTQLKRLLFSFFFVKQNLELKNLETE